MGRIPKKERIWLCQSPSHIFFFFFELLNFILFIFLYSRFLLVIYFIHISVYMSIPISPESYLLGTPELPVLVPTHTHSFLSLSSLPEGVLWQHEWAQPKCTAGQKCQELTPQEGPLINECWCWRINTPAPLGLSEWFLRQVPHKLSEDPQWDGAPVIHSSNSSINASCIGFASLLPHFPPPLSWFLRSPPK